MTGGWEEEILERLKIRDKVEAKDLRYFEAFELLRLKKSMPDGSQRPLEVENARLVDKLNSKTLVAEQKESVILGLQRQLRAAEKTIASQQAKIEGLAMEVKEKNRSIEVVNDEVLMNQIQTAVLQKKVDELTTENESLVKRWMERVSNEAQQMNDANQFLQNLPRG